MVEGCLPVVHYRANLQSVHGFSCYDNIAPDAKCQRVLVLALCPVATINRDTFSQYFPFCELRCFGGEIPLLYRPDVYAVHHSSVKLGVLLYKF